MPPSLCTPQANTVSLPLLRANYLAEKQGWRHWTLEDRREKGIEEQERLWKGRMQPQRWTVRFSAFYSFWKELQVSSVPGCWCILCAQYQAPGLHGWINKYRWLSDSQETLSTPSLPFTPGRQPSTSHTKAGCGSSTWWKHLPASLTLSLDLNHPLQSILPCLFIPWLYTPTFKRQ